MKKSITNDHISEFSTQRLTLQNDKGLVYTVRLLIRELKVMRTKRLIRLRLHQMYK